MSERGYLMVRIKRPWVPGWLWRLACRWMPLAYLLSVHELASCECWCHDTDGMRDCVICGWRA